MKKWFSHTWKYYLVWSLLMFAYIFLANYYTRDIFFRDFTYLDNDSIYWTIQNYMEGINYIYMTPPGILLVGCVLMKLFRYWIEKDSHGRTFFASLPMKKEDQKRSQILADFLVVILVYVLLTIVVAVSACKLFHIFEFRPDWFVNSLIGEMITAICYTWMLIGLVHLIEAVFVNGIGKFVGIIVTYVCVGLLQDGASLVFKWTEGIQKVYGFLFCELPGKQYYEFYNDPNSFSLYVGGWTPEVVYASKIYESIKPEYIPEQYWKDEVIWDAGARFYHFSDISSYIGYAIAYLVIGIVFCVIATKLVQKQDLSKKLFYFGATQYVFAVLIGSAFWFVMMVNASGIGHIVTISISAILLILLTIYLCARVEHGEIFQPRK